MTTRAFRSIAILAMVALFPAPAMAAAPHERDGIVLGFNLGAGSGGVNVEGIDSERESGFGGNLRVAYAFTPQVAAGIEGSVWSRVVDDETWSFGVTALALTYYPGAGGFFVRGGIGVGSVEYGLESGGVNFSASDDGFGFLVATGYEWRLTRRFALGPQFEYGHGKVNDDLSMNYWNVTAGLNWYF